MTETLVEIVRLLINQGIDVAADVAKMGSADAGRFDVSTTLQFARVTASTTTMEGPTVTSVARSVAGTAATRHNVGWFPLPDSYYSYDVTFFVTADSGDVVAELDENNTRVLVCRVLQEERVYPPQDSEIELCPAW